MVAVLIMMLAAPAIRRTSYGSGGYGSAATTPRRHVDDAYLSRCPDCGYPFTGGHDYAHENWRARTNA